MTGVRVVVLVVLVGCTEELELVDDVVDVVTSQTSVSIESPEQSPDRQQPRYSSLRVPLSTHLFMRLLQTESRQPRRQMATAQRSFAQRSSQRW